MGSCCGCRAEKPMVVQQKQKIEQKPILEIEKKPSPVINEQPKPVIEQKPVEVKIEPKPIEPPVIEKEEYQPQEEIKIQNTKPEEDLNPKDDETQLDQDIQNFEDAIASIRDKNNHFNLNKESIERQLNRLFSREQDENELNNQSQNNDFQGPKIINRNICDIKNKYDFSRVKEFTEYRGTITLVRLIQKQKSPICTFIGKIEQKYCCVKLIPMANLVHIKKWIESVKKAQSKENLNNDVFLDANCQKYYYYKVEELNNEPDYCNCYIISNLEQYNAYTFSHHPNITLTEKLSVAYYVIQIISVVLKNKTEQDELNQQPTKLTKQIFKKMFTVKRNNILISRLQGEQTRFQIILSDWQLLLPEFEEIISNKKLQNEDKLYEGIEKNINEIISSSRNLGAQAQQQQQQNQGMQSNTELNKNIRELDDFTKRVLQLLFFRVNFELLSDVELCGFINESKFENICETKINIIEKQDIKDYENLTKIIQNYSQKGENQQNVQQVLEQTNKFCTKKSQLIFYEFQLNNSHNCPQIYIFYLLLKNLRPEAIRTALKDLEQGHQKQEN